MKRIGVLAAVVLAAAFVSGAGGGTAKIDLSTRAGVTQYLVAHGIDATGVVIQRGARNYAGPSCPGKGWTCTNATRVVQVSKWDNTFQCTPSSGGTASGPDSCVIVQVSTGGDNYARCNERSSAPVVAQSCTVTQQNTTGVNTAVVSQWVDVGPGGNHDDDDAIDVIDDNSDSTDAGDTSNVRRMSVVLDVPTETATQTASVTQTNGSGDNATTLNQGSSQRTLTTDASGMQTQDAHQSATVSQTADSGGNTSDVDQSLEQRATATGLPVVTQAQNGQAGGPNTDAHVTQTSMDGRNVSTLHQVNDLRMHFKKTKKVAATVTQIQGTPAGGLNGHVDQSSPELSKSVNVQHERQREDGGGAATLSQTQFGPAACCSIQQSNPRDVFKIRQNSRQRADQGAFQSNLVLGNCDTSGNCAVNEHAWQNGVTTQNGCTGPSCHPGITCGETGCSPCTSGSVDNQCPSPPGTTFRLTVVVIGGNGDNDVVTSKPGTIDCGSTCTNDFAPGTQVELIAETSCDFGNGSWDGADNSDGNLAFVTMTGDRTVTARYGNAC